MWARMVGSKIRKEKKLLCFCHDDAVLYVLRCLRYDVSDLLSTCIFGWCKYGVGPGVLLYIIEAHVQLWPFHTARSVSSCIVWHMYV